jgi:DNA-binding CsgD family transcriptional regulator
MKRLSAKILDRGPLTPKEAEVLRYLCEGYFRPEIALKLCRTLSTVSAHIEHIAEKLDARGTTEIVLIAQQMGLIEISLKPRNNALLKSFIIFIALTQLNGQMIIRRPPRHQRPAVQRIYGRRGQEIA